MRPAARHNGYPLFGPDGGYGPQVFVSAYDLPTADGDTGTGRASGVEMDGDFLDSDLAAYLAYFGVTRTGPPSTRISVDGGAPAFPGGGANETTLDVETLVSLAPGTALYVYEIPALQDAPLIDAFNRARRRQPRRFTEFELGRVGDAGARAAGGGRCRFDREAVPRSAEGITFHASSGDWGVYCYGSIKISVCLPASTPHNIAVGGTTLLVDQDTGKETSEIGWNEPGFGNASGGGVSVVFHLPSYQKGVPNILARGRNVPDIAFDGDPLTGESPTTSAVVAMDRKPGHP